MRWAGSVLCLGILTFLGSAATVPQQRLQAFRKKVFKTESAALSVVTAGINTARNSPREWGGGAVGFGKRVGSAFGQHLVKGTIEFGVGNLLHEDLHYQRSNLQGNWPRLKYAVKSTFIVPRTNKPGKTLAVSRIAGNMGGGLISRAWQPASTAGLGAGLASGGIGLGADVGIHVAREFWPRKKSKQ